MKKATLGLVNLINLYKKQKQSKNKKQGPKIGANLIAPTTNTTTGVWSSGPCSPSPCRTRL
jgi:hypothetical protein